jgi:hypothetical protein
MIDPIISDFDDRISTLKDADEEDVNFSVTIDDFKSLEEKLLFYIRTHTDEPLICQIQNLVKPTQEAIVGFKSIVLDISNSQDEYDELFTNEEDIVPFVRRNIEMNPDEVDKFIAIQKAKGLNEIQSIYLKELLIFIAENGKFCKNDLLKEELNFGSMFDSIAINSLISELEQIL